ncbi:hypothetical protein EWK04_26395 [Salmonella enterica subsp. enterica serovar Java]|uniref:Uncharacterized protein n=1 Tax=Salmonella enterica subsp. enterica serovar Java TaxID=224729 RepID=A0A3Y9C5T0_SALEB|nr:hypothetical protein [Salmonella enterica subsp. enterica serovar Java]ECG3202200.1 hypothetical protein [Salmonella enterica subsp. enterica serovar Java]
MVVSMWLLQAVVPVQDLVPWVSDSGEVVAVEGQETPLKAISQVIFPHRESSQPVFWFSRLAAGEVMGVSMYPVRSPQQERHREECLSG